MATLPLLPLVLAFSFPPESAVSAELLRESPVFPVEAAHDVRPVVLRGEVLFPDGRAAEGAAVVSTAGGLAQVGPDGTFALEIELAFGVEALELTALRSGDGSNWTARRRIEGLGSLGAGEGIPAGTLLLAQTQGCEPGWLPTIGELLLWPQPPLFVYQQGPLANGAASFSIFIPPVPELVGKSFAMQAVIVALNLPVTPLELSNGLVMTVLP